MRFLILIFVLFLGCEDDPVSPPDTDGGNPHSTNQIVGSWSSEFWQVYHNADCQSDFSDTFNMGIGFCIVVPSERIGGRIQDTIDIISGYGLKAWTIGQIVVK